MTFFFFFLVKQGTITVWKLTWPKVKLPDFKGLNEGDRDSFTAMCRFKKLEVISDMQAGDGKNSKGNGKVDGEYGQISEIDGRN